MMSGTIKAYAKSMIHVVIRCDQLLIYKSYDVISFNLCIT